MAPTSENTTSREINHPLDHGVILLLTFSCRTTCYHEHFHIPRKHACSWCTSSRAYARFLLDHTTEDICSTISKIVRKGRKGSNFRSVVISDWALWVPRECPAASRCTRPTIVIRTFRSRPLTSWISLPLHDFVFWSRNADEVQSVATRPGIGSASPTILSASKVAMRPYCLNT